MLLYVHRTSLPGCHVLCEGTFQDKCSCVILENLRQSNNGALQTFNASEIGHWQVDKLHVDLPSNH